MVFFWVVKNQFSFFYIWRDMFDSNIWTTSGINNQPTKIFGKDHVKDCKKLKKKTED